MKISRRDTMKGAAMLGIIAGCTPRGLKGTPGRPKLRTPLCDLLGIEYPLLQSGMGAIAGSELALAVSKAGGLGAIGATDLEVDELRTAIREMRAATDRPFAVNLLLASEFLTSPVADPGILKIVHAMLNPFRERLGLPAVSAAPTPLEEFVPQLMEVILEEKPPVFSSALGIPPPGMMKKLHERGIKVTAMVTTVADARIAEEAGVDVVIAQGWEAGGHRSHLENPATAQIGSTGTLALVREVVEKIKVPVVAAGGISDGRGMAAALALGASGVLMGTRFVATRESTAKEGYKRTITTKSGDETVVTNGYSGRFARMVRNQFVDVIAKQTVVLPYPLQVLTISDVSKVARKNDDVELQVMLAGQGIGVLHEILGAGDVVAKVVLEAREAVKSLRTQFDV